jgi:aerobic-type carbon monoxide dehydrogenase small subunit (CoxS/CutS family)
MSRQMITLTVNGDTHELLVSERQTLLDVIRDTIGLTGTKEGCATGKRFCLASRPHSNGTARLSPR